MLPVIRVMSAWFSEQKQEAGVIKDKSKKKKQAESAEPMPITLWSDSATYDQGKGDFLLKVCQDSAGGWNYSDYQAEGNMKTGDVWLKQGGTLQEPDTTMNGEWVHYNFNSKTGEIKQIDGKVPRLF